ncbi:DAK2 domain-containing protein [Hoyosella sp. G463]|uniref:DAK2 domain-containing protein n=1 Tax=Lolliginicoccus lacisalsi TaxID=2742202 RepID=A0A927JE05_9ACTN|nr:DAK2 domain-containing protein [Lolliginicoccus lacisalsi]MBD8507594.1 DAK2 domain-containing protein [Lolliginicoccus lacisalsi]
MRWAHACVGGLEARREEINILNVFPIADSDTGTNLHFTMRAAYEKARAECVPLDGMTTHDVAVVLARGAVAGARGNSGVILSQVLRGVADAALDGSIDGQVLRNALTGALQLVGDSMSHVVEGTVVTVLRGAATAARDADEHDLASVARAAVAGAVSALDETPSQLSVLGQAGVVDAGGVGLLIILDALVEVVTGEPTRRPRFTARAAARPVADGSAATVSVGKPSTAVSGTTLAEPSGNGHRPGAGIPSGAAGQSAECVHSTEHVHEYATGDVEYEIMYLLRGCDDAAAAVLREKLSDLGDSVIVVGDGSGAFSVHVHSTDPGAAVEAGIPAGVPYDIRITAFGADQQGFTPSSAPRVREVLAIVNGEAGAELFRSEGASVLTCGHECSPQELLDAVLATTADEVFVLPNGFIRPEELVGVSTQARQLGHPAVLLPTASLVQGLAALAVHDPHRAASDDSYAMAAAAAATRWGSVRRAQEKALSLAGACEPGDYLGLVGHEVLVIKDEFLAATLHIVDLMLGAGGELLTILRGAAQTNDTFAEQLEDHINKNHPGVELMIYVSGQDEDILQIGVE